ncbi:MAG: hypothetical protein M3014_02570 [Chloroflexota bacterium]|nr:hypothetical protein [Chloroflexota bacterium]
MTSTDTTPIGICIHDHFCQPPREDPARDAIPDEYGAKPYRNWNERTHAERYRPNAEPGNFAGISFNVGPTLFGWMASYDPQTSGSSIEQRGIRLPRRRPHTHVIGADLAPQTRSELRQVVSRKSGLRGNTVFNHSLSLHCTSPTDCAHMTSEQLKRYIQARRSICGDERIAGACMSPGPIDAPVEGNSCGHIQLNRVRCNSA